MIKHLMRIIFLLVAFSFAVMLAQVQVDGRYIFPVCFVLSLLIFGGAVAYLRMKSQKVLSFMMLALMAGISFYSAPVVAADVEQMVYTADSEMGKELINKIRSANSQLASVDALAQYKEIMSGEADMSSITIDGSDLKLAQDTLSYCAQVDYSSFSDVDQTCGNAKGIADIAGRIEGGLGKGCSPITVMIKNLVNKNNCWPCDITKLVISSIQNVAQASYATTSAAALNLLGGLFLVWLAIVTVTFFGKFGFARISEYLTNVLNKSVLVLLIAAFLHLPALELYKLTISPFISFTADLAQTFSDTGRREAKKAGGILNILQKVMSLGSTPKCKYCNGSGYSGATAFLDAQSVNGLLCVVCTVYHQVSPLIVLGQGLTCFADVSKASNESSPGLSANGATAIPRVGALLTGAGIILIFSFMMVIIAYYAVVAVLQLGFVIVLFPFWMVAYAFKPSREYTKNAWALVANSMVLMISLSFSVALVIVGFSDLLSDRVALALGWAMVSGTPVDIMGAFSGSETLAAQQAQEGGSMFEGLTNSLIQMGINSLIGVSPIQAVLLLVAYAFLSISMVNGSSQIVEKLLNVWLQREADADGALMQGIQKAGQGVQGAAKMSGTMAAIAAGATSKALQKTTQRMQDARWAPHLAKDSKAAEAQAKQAGMTPEAFHNQQHKNDQAMKKEEEAAAKKAAAANKTGGDGKAGDGKAAGDGKTDATASKGDGGAASTAAGAATDAATDAASGAVSGGTGGPTAG